MRRALVVDPVVVKRKGLAFVAWVGAGLGVDAETRLDPSLMNLLPPLPIRQMVVGLLVLFLLLQVFQLVMSVNHVVVMVCCP